MNLKLYKFLCRVSDKILKSKNSSYKTIAISSLHILKEHPTLFPQFIKKKNKTETNFNFEIFKKFFVYLVNFFIERNNFYLDKKLIRRHDVLIISNIINKNHINNKDFYFGDLEKKLNKLNIKTVTAIRNFTNNKTSNLKKNLKRNRILLSQRTSILFELKIILEIFREYLYVNKIIINEKNLKKKSILKKLISIKSIAYNLRISNQIKQLVKILKPNLLIIPFEGHAWERLVIKNCKDSSSDLKIAAYQFSVKTENQHSLFRPLKREYNPDIILSSGIVTQKYFKKKYDCPVKILGSPKFSKSIKKNKFNNNFLILPEAFQSEMEILYNFSLAAAKKYPEYNFIYRPHPMAYKYLDNLNKINLKNFKISKNKFKVDLSYCGYAIYRGSASIFESISHGLFPIYLNKKNELNINPLYSVLPKKFIVNDTKDIESIVRNNEKKKKFKSIKQYTEKYFMKLNANIIKSINLN